MAKWFNSYYFSEMSCILRYDRRKITTAVVFFILFLKNIIIFFLLSNYCPIGINNKIAVQNINIRENVCSSVGSVDRKLNKWLGYFLLTYTLKGLIDVVVLLETVLAEKAEGIETFPSFSSFWLIFTAIVLLLQLAYYNISLWFYQKVNFNQTSLLSKLKQNVYYTLRYQCNCGIYIYWFKLHVRKLFTKAVYFSTDWSFRNLLF